MVLRRRVQLFEFLDLPWVTGWLRQGMLEYLNFLLYRMAQPYRGVERIISAWAREAGADAVLDMGSGGGGHIDWLLRRSDASGLSLPRFVLSDLFPQPNLRSYQSLQAIHGEEKVTFIKDPVNACCPEERGLRLRSMFSIFHHLTPDQAQRMLSSACTDADGILIAEGVHRSIPAAFAMAMLLPVYMFFMPFAAPHFSARRLFFSAVIPIIPLIMTFDGVISVLRAYEATEIVSLFPEGATAEFEINTYRFRFLSGIFVTTVVTARRKGRNAKLAPKNDEAAGNQAGSLVSFVPKLASLAPTPIHAAKGDQANTQQANRQRLRN